MVLLNRLVKRAMRYNMASGIIKKKFDSKLEAVQYIQNKNLNQSEFVVRRGDSFDQRTVKAIQGVKI